MPKQNRLIFRVRKNPDFLAMKQWCKDLGLNFEICAPTGKGHPKALISNGATEIKFTLASSPGARCDKRAVVSNLERSWALALERANET